MIFVQGVPPLPAVDISLTYLSTLIAGAAMLIGLLIPGIISIITAVKVGKIEANVNSQKTASEGRELTLKRENELLREMLTAKTLEASLLAQAVAHRSRAEPPALPHQQAPVSVVIENQPGDEVPVVVKPGTDL